MLAAVQSGTERARGMQERLGVAWPLYLEVGPWLRVMTDAIWHRHRVMDEDGRAVVGRRGDIAAHAARSAGMMPECLLRSVLAETHAIAQHLSGCVVRLQVVWLAQVERRIPLN